MTAQTDRPLRIGILVDSYSELAWAAKLIEDVRNRPFLDLVMMLLPVEDRRGCQPLFPMLFGAFFRCYEWLDRRLFTKKADALAPVDIRAICAGVPTVFFALEPTAERDGATMNMPEEIAAGRLDVIFDLSSSAVGAALAESAKYGVWSCHPGEARSYEDLPPLVTEMRDGNPLSTTVLRFQTERDGIARVLCRGTFATDRNSLYVTRNASAWNSAAYAIRRLSDLYLHGWDHLTALEGFGEPDTYVPSEARVPGPMTTTGLAVRLVTRFLRRRVTHWRFATPWLVAYRMRCVDAASEPRARELRLMLPEPGGSYADPFPFSRDGKQFLFFEECRPDRRRGVISFVEIDGSGRVTEPETILETDYHLSYPFVFEWQGDVYMLPETGAHQTIELYRAVEFPRRWVLDRTVMHNISAVDCTVFRVGDLFWMFANTAAPSGNWGEELSLFHAETPLGPWTAHPRNPVVTDVRRARPAGNLFMADGRLIRPGQDCSVRYGHAVVLNLVEALSTTEYRERPVDTIHPDWWPGALCTHTMNRNDCIEAVDLKAPIRRAKLRAAARSKDGLAAFPGNKDDWRKAWPCFELK